MRPTHVPDHADRGLSLVLSQYRGKPIFEAWARSYLRRVQELEDATYSVIVDRFLANAVGAALDAIGRLVGEPRRSRVDDIYQIFLTARIRINRSFGRWEDVIDVYNIVCSAPKIATEVGPANIIIEITDVPSLPNEMVFAMLSDAKSGGVGLQMIAATAPPSTQFRWGTVGSEATPSLQGFGSSTDPTTGGRLATAIT